MTGPLVLVTWFHADAESRSGSYSQIRGSSASAATYEVYLRCVDVCVASFRRWNPDGPCLVVLNPAADAVVGAERRELWRRMRVEVRVIENRHRPDTDLFAEWQNQFFLFDVLQAALGLDGDGPLVVVDSDVVVQGPLDALAGEIVARGRVAMRIPYPEDEVANGSSRIELAGFVRERSGRSDFVPVYQGGEFVSGTRAELAALVAACEDVYRWTLQRQRRGEGHPHEEAQMISVAAPLPDEAITGNRYIERIWTKPWNLRLLPDDVRSIPLWHVPAEKKTGIRRLHAAALQPRSWFWRATPERWRRRAGAMLGVPVFGPGKFVRDVVALRGDVLPAVRERLARLRQHDRD